MAWVAEHPNLVVLRTFSKCAALAGLRVGYGAFPAGLIEYMWRAKQPYNVSVAAEVCAGGSGGRWALLAGQLSGGQPAPPPVACHAPT